jgi:hypothetical protein
MITSVLTASAAVALAVRGRSSSTEISPTRSPTDK